MVCVSFPIKASGEVSLLYNDAEEVLCFEWIVRFAIWIFSIEYNDLQDEERSRLNIERLIWLERDGLLHPMIRELVLELIHTPYVFTEDILSVVQEDSEG